MSGGMASQRSEVQQHRGLGVVSRTTRLIGVI